AERGRLPRPPRRPRRPRPRRSASVPTRSTNRSAISRACATAASSPPASSRRRSGRSSTASEGPAGAYDRGVADDERRAERSRGLAGDEPDLTEKKMFGGLAFRVGGNMAIAASGQGGVLVRVDPEESEELVAGSDAYVAVMRGRPMEGWLRVD